MDVANANHTDVPRLRPGTTEYAALLRFLRTGLELQEQLQLDVVSPCRHALKSVLSVQTRSVGPLKNSTEVARGSAAGAGFAFLKGLLS